MVIYLGPAILFSLGKLWNMGKYRPVQGLQKVPFNSLALFAVQSKKEGRTSQMTWNDFFLHCHPTTRRRYGWQALIGCYSSEPQRIYSKHRASHLMPMCITCMGPCPYILYCFDYGHQSFLFLWGEPAGLLGLPGRCMFEQLVGGSWHYYLGPKHHLNIDTCIYTSWPLHAEYCF